MVVASQILRGGSMALVLYPFYQMIGEHKRSMLILFFALWGIALLGSLEPMPGSIEGMIYTKTTFIEHFMVLTANAIQVTSIFMAVS